jgi:hypothetical protein
MGLPKSIAQGIYGKIDALKKSDPRRAGKPLTGPFVSFRSLTYGRYRAIFRVVEERLANGDALLRVQLTVVAVGIRKERDKNDVYKVAQRLIDLGIIQAHSVE